MKKTRLFCLTAMLLAFSMAWADAVDLAFGEKMSESYQWD